MSPNKLGAYSFDQEKVSELTKGACVWRYHASLQDHKGQSVSWWAVHVRNPEFALNSGRGKAKINLPKELLFDSRTVTK